MSDALTEPAPDTKSLIGAAVDIGHYLERQSIAFAVRLCVTLAAGTYDQDLATVRDDLIVRARQLARMLCALASGEFADEEQHERMIASSVQVDRLPVLVHQ